MLAYILPCRVSIPLMFAFVSQPLLLTSLVPHVGLMLQSVDKTVSPRYYALIEAFRSKTGVPILLNTSFNENEPIVNSPAEALDCFLRTQMDMLVMENIIVER